MKLPSLLSETCRAPISLARATGMFPAVLGSTALAGDVAQDGGICLTCEALGLVPSTAKIFKNTITKKKKKKLLEALLLKDSTVEPGLPGSR